MRDRIINSMLDDDLYKFTMQQAVIQHFPRYKTRFRFTDRGDTEYPDGFGKELREQVKSLEGLALTKDEFEYMADTKPFLTPVYLDFLKGYRYDSSEVGIFQDGGNLDIQGDGYWYRNILWEVKLLALVSQLYHEMTGETPISRAEREKRNFEKGNFYRENNIKMADFGTRRRASYENHDEVIKDYLSCFNTDKWFMGTSNVHLAMKHNIRAIGTHAHEWFMFHAAKYGYRMANRMALENWVKTYQGDLGIALPDTFTSEVFFQPETFDMQMSKLFDGVRQDSMNPFDFTDLSINHYESVRINPSSKNIVFSDSFDKEGARDVNNYCRGKEVNGRKLAEGKSINCSFGIGTYTTNDIGLNPRKIVIKMSEAQINNRWVPTVKLSDVAGKHTGDSSEVIVAKHNLGISTSKVVEVA